MAGVVSVELAVELYGTRVGTVTGAHWRTADITFSTDALARWGVNSPVLSVAAPLSLRPRRGHAERRRNVLSELLPEGPMRERLARMAGVATTDAAGLLTRFGRDVAGAVAVFDPRSPWEPPTPGLEPLADADIAELINELALGNHPFAGKTSLAGVQPKLVLTRHETGAWYQPVGGAASSHIVKPALPGHEAELAEEEYGHRLAVRMGLASTDVHRERLGGRECLVIERYDRAGPNGTERVHQEDFNQALALRGDEKYQEIGGRARLARVAEVLRAHTDGGVTRLAVHMVTAVATGNLDLHAKNLALLHFPEGTTATAPAYDMVPMAHRVGVDGRLAMAVSDEYRLAAVTRTHLEREVRSWGGDPGQVGATLERLRDVVETQSVPSGGEPVQPMVLTAVTRLLGGEPIGNAFTEGGR